MKKLLFISMLGVFAVFSSCDEDEIVQSQVDFLFKETYCADPWDTIISPGWIPEQLISYYLTDVLEVEYSYFNRTNDGIQEDCEACHCLSGNIIRFSADDEFSEILLENGFEIDE